MKLLIITQKVDINDDLLGFFYGWISEFAKQCEKVTVVCLFKGEYNLPKNVKVLSLGKEEGCSRIKYLIRFYKYIWQDRNNYDNVFVHMTPIYIILGSFFWKAWKKKIGLWYTHKHVDLKLKIAERLIDIIFTASKESFRLKSKKVRVIGHGIDIKKFRISNFEFRISDNLFKLIAVGRISPIKDYETLIKSVEILKKDGIKLKVDIIGGPGLPKDREYLDKLKKTVKIKNLESEIRFLGSIPNKDIAQHLQSADLFVHMSRTGSLDKTILEAMASSLIVISCNDASRDLLSNFGDKLFYRMGDEKELAEKIKKIMKLSKDERINLGGKLHQIVAQDHALEIINKKIINNYKI